jgi:hypothetical protein
VFGEFKVLANSLPCRVVLDRRDARIGAVHRLDLTLDLWIVDTPQAPVADDIVNVASGVEDDADGCVLVAADVPDFHIVVVFPCRLESVCVLRDVVEVSCSEHELAAAGEGVLPGARVLLAELLVVELAPQPRIGPRESTDGTRVMARVSREAAAPVGR